MNPLTLFQFLFLFLFSLWSSAQPVFDTFSDTLLTSNPPWQGDLGHWKVDNGMLRSSGPAVSGTCIGLQTPTPSGDSVEWQFYTDLKLATSANNYLEFLLNTSNGESLVIKLGGTADEVSLYRRKASGDSLLIDGSDKRLASSSSNKLLVRLRKAGTAWQLETSTDFQHPNWLSEGAYNLSPISPFATLGFRACYSSANSGNFWVDEVYAGQWRIDREPPFLVHAYLYDSAQWRFVFSEAMDTSKGSFGPTGMKPQWLDLLTAKAPLMSAGDTQVLELNGFRDLAGLSLPDTLIKGVRRRLEFRELMISELMPDPSPPKAMPEVEWIELYNAGPEAIQLVDFRLSDATSSVSFPYRTIKPDSFLILTATGNCSVLPAPCQELPISSTFLNNASDQLVLVGRQGDTLEKLAYSDTWYKDDHAKNGGCSLEKTDPENKCVTDAVNFRASRAVQGATPGIVNSVDERLLDTLAPFVTSFRIVQADVLEWTLSEAFDTSLLEIEVNGLAQNFLLTGPLTVRIFLNQPLLDDPFNRNSWSLGSLKDCSGNLGDERDSFRYALPKEPEPFELMFSEILFLPANGSPAFFEVYNRSDRALDLSGMKLEYSGKQWTLPPFVLYPAEELILHGSSDSFFKTRNGKLAGWKNPDKQEGMVSLRNVFGSLIDAFSYSDTFFTTATQQMGGYSLERLDSSANCSRPEFWKPSALAGGSPGSTSFMEINTSEQLTYLQSVYPLDEKTLLLRFSQALSPEAEPGVSLSPDNTLLSWQQQGNDYRNWKLEWQDDLLPSQLYTLTIEAGLSCEGRILENMEIGFQLPQAKGQVRINELLFDPFGEEPDFVELVNAGDFAVDLKGYVIAGMDESGNLEDPIVISTEGYLLMPGEYVVITSKGHRLANRYSYYREEKVLICSSLPSFPNEGGTVLLLDSFKQVLDSFHYEEDMHSAFLTNTEGISLERINPQEATNNPANWTSASATEHFGTPGRKNSQHRDRAVGKEYWQLLSGTFSPDGDGFEDLAILSYQGLEPGTHASIQVFSLSGHFLYEWANNWSCGTHGTLSWEGQDRYGQSLPIGPYLLWISWIDVSGKQKVEKKVLVKAGQFND